MGKSNANECNESSLSNCRVQLALSTKKDGMILEKRLDDFRNQIHIIPLSRSSPDFSAYATSTLLRHIFSISCLPDNITHTILQTVRLVINLLQHKVIKTTLAQLADVQIHGLDIVMTGRMLHDRSRITGDTLRTQPRHR